MLISNFNKTLDYENKRDASIIFTYVCTVDPILISVGTTMSRRDRS